MVAFLHNWWFPFLNHAKSGYTVTRRTFLRNSLTVCQDALSHRTLIRRYVLFKKEKWDCWWNRREIFDGLH